MKSKIILLLICIAAMAVPPSCGSKTSSSESSAEKPSIEIRKPDFSEVPTLTTSPAMGDFQSSLKPEAEETLRNCINCMFTASTEETLKYLYPQKIYEKLVGSSAMENFAVSGSEVNEVLNINIDTCKALSPNPWAKTVRQYFEQTAASNGIELMTPIMPSTPYEVTATVEVNIDGEKGYLTIPAVLAFIPSDGWKVIPLSGEQLASAVEGTDNN